jgi:hypothetical protein
MSGTTLTVDPSEVQTIEVDPSYVSAAPADPLTQEAQSAAAKAGAPTTPAPLPISKSNIAKKGLFGEDISPQEEERIKASAAHLQGPSLSHSFVADPALTLTGASELEGALAEKGIKGVAKSAGRSLIKSAATATAGAGIGAAAGDIVGQPKRGAEIGAGIGLTATPFVNDRALADVPVFGKMLFSDAELAEMQSARKVAQRTADMKAGLLPPPPDPVRVQQEKDAADSAAVISRYEKELEEKQTARAAAEKQMKKAHEDFASKLSQIEKGRQGELADRAQLNEKWAQALNARGRDVATAEAEESRAEQRLRAARTTLRPQSLGAAAASGIRPTDSEQFLTSLTKKPIISVEDDAQGRRYFGNSWKLKPGEGHQERVSRLLGLVRSGRSAQGMADTSIGPSLAP